jgi:protein-L-isoaspartate(D-aspartate) O-methyltransferase
LRDQLALGGRLIIPVGGGEQALVMIEKTPQGWAENRFDAVRFVPLLPGVA